MCDSHTNPHTPSPSINLARSLCVTTPFLNTKCSHLYSILIARSLCDSNPPYNSLLGVVATGNSAVYGGAMYIAASQELCGDPDNCFMVGGRESVNVCVGRKCDAQEV